MQDEYTIPVCGLFIVWETSFPYDKNAPRGCALGARVDGCRSNRASARECAKAHSFLLYRKDRLRRSLELKKARTEAGTTSRR